MSDNLRPTETAQTAGLPVQYRSRAFRLARWILAKTEQSLPGSVYRVLYRATFATYRKGIAFNYRLRCRRLCRLGDVHGLRRARAVRKVMPYSLVGPSGLEVTYDAVFQVLKANVPGAIVECGVAQGGSSAVMALAMADVGHTRDLWLFDSYEGLPDPTAEDVDPESNTTGAHIRPLPRGSCLGTYEEVEALMTGIASVAPRRLHMIKGWFEDTLPREAQRIGPIAILRLDGDWYRSTRCCLENLYRQVCSGGVLIIDDYFSCHGAKRAVDEFMGEQEEGVPEFVPDGSGGMSFFKQ